MMYYLITEGLGFHLFTDFSSQAQIQRRQTQRADYEAFLKAFEKLPDQLTEFALETWHSLVDFATVYSENDIRFTFKNGQEGRA